MTVTDIIYLVIFVFVIAVGAIITSMVTTPLTTALTPIVNTTRGGNETITLLNTTNSSLDGIVICIAFGSLLFAVVSAWLINSHPIFLWPAIIFGAVGLFITPFLANAYGSFISSDSTVATAAASFPMTTALFQYYPYFILGAFILIVIVTVAKPAESRGY